MKKKKVAAILWDIYLKSCVCHMDYSSSCSCRAAEAAEEQLRKMYGPDWHEIVREKAVKWMV